MAFTLSTNPVEQKKQLADMMERSQKILAELTSPLELFPEYRRVTSPDSYTKAWSEYLPPACRFASVRAGRSAWDAGSD